MGAVPPLSDADWQKAFAAYQKIPEYTEIKRGMSLDEFKTIFWWEWTHRFLGRFIGFVFLVPFVGFLIAGYIPRILLPKLLGLFVLGGLQGALGWYMVKSGLVDRTDVSQYRLAAHFGVALSILGYTLWLLFGLGSDGRAGLGKPARSGLRRLLNPRPDLFAAAGRCSGRGLDAGLGFNTWPLINGALVPSGLGEASPWYLNLFENPLTVQFDHRMLGYTVVIATFAQLAWLALERAPATPCPGREDPGTDPGPVRPAPMPPLSLRLRSLSLRRTPPGSLLGASLQSPWPTRSFRLRAYRGGFSFGTGRGPNSPGAGGQTLGDPPGSGKPGSRLRPPSRCIGSAVLRIAERGGGLVRPACRRQAPVQSARKCSVRRVGGPRTESPLRLETPCLARFRTTNRFPLRLETPCLARFRTTNRFPLRLETL